MAPRAIKRWPEHWYDNEGCVFCPAEGCNKRWENARRLKNRPYHWNDRCPSSPSYYDHKILHAISNQTHCVYCNYSTLHPHLDLRDLLAHEQIQHKSTNMSTIPGYLSLVRKGLIPDDTLSCRDEIFQRLVQNIWLSPYRNRLLFRAYPFLLPCAAGMITHIDPIFCFQNHVLRRPTTTIILAKDFLVHLAPAPGEQSPWAETYAELCARYADGSI